MALTEARAGGDEIAAAKADKALRVATKAAIDAGTASYLYFA